MNSDGRRTIAAFFFFAFTSLAKVLLGETEAWLTGCPHFKERLPRELSGEPMASSPHLQTRCSADAVKLTSSAFQTHEKGPQVLLEQQPRGAMAPRGFCFSICFPDVSVGSCRHKCILSWVIVVFE